MANTVVGNCIIVNSANQYLLANVATGVGGGGAPMLLKGVALAMTTTDAVLQLAMGVATTSVFIQLDKWLPAISWDGLWTQDVIVTNISAGTGFVYFG